MADPERRRRNRRHGRADARPTKLERRLRPSHHGPLDYDDSLVPGQIVASIMHLPHVTAREENELGLALRWSYGSAFGLWHGILHRRFGEPWASALFVGNADERDACRCSRCSVERRRRGDGRRT